ncbi:unnamed protein product [Paramecium primaurelia]|uniref:Uncharacterized protein n=1 Tax=Paramecium primaurelia TaxID=5886 RepID=A0A8S1P1J5_PARPR|nr:unnamed protein product [Paramecium primaurelia]
MKAGYLKENFRETFWKKTYFQTFQRKQQCLDRSFGTIRTCKGDLMIQQEICLQYQIQLMRMQYIQDIMALQMDQINNIQQKIIRIMFNMDLT